MGAPIHLSLPVSARLTRPDRLSSANTPRSEGPEITVRVRGITTGLHRRSGRSNRPNAAWAGVPATGRMHHAPLQRRAPSHRPPALHGRAQGRDHRVLQGRVALDAGHGRADGSSSSVPILESLQPAPRTSVGGSRPRARQWSNIAPRLASAMAATLRVPCPAPHSAVTVNGHAAGRALRAPRRGSSRR